MVFRLVLDAARRKWLMAAFAVFQLYLLFKIPLKIWPASESVAWTMAGAWFLTIGASELSNLRELYQLPVSRRTWWRARWWLSMTAPVVIVQLAAAFSLWEARSQWPAADEVVMSSVLAALYCGTALALEATSLGRIANAPATLWSTLSFLPFLLGLIAAPFLVAPYLAQSFSEISATSAIVLLVMAAFTARGYVYTPAIRARPHSRSALSQPSVHGPAPAVIRRPPGIAGRMTGLKLVVWEECRKHLTTFSAVLVVGVACWAVASRFRPVATLGEVLRLAGVLPFSSPQAMITEPIVLGALVLVATITEPGMVANLRSLRARPLSAGRLSGIPAGLGLLSAAMLWVVLLALHGVLLRTLPSSLRPDLFIAFAALVATAQTIRFITPGHEAGKSMLGFAPIALTWLALAYFGDSWRADAMQRGMLIGGLLTLVATWAAMRHAVTRSSAIYRPRPIDARVSG